MSSVRKKTNQIGAFILACAIFCIFLFQGVLQAFAMPTQQGQIIQQPTEEGITYGETAVFSVGIQGEATLQWQKKAPGGSFADIPGENSQMLTLESPVVSESGSVYRCEIQFQGQESPVYSDEATLTVTKRAATGALAGNASGDGDVTLTALLPQDAQGSITFQKDGTAMGDPVSVQGGKAEYVVKQEELPQQQGEVAEFTAIYSGDGNTEAGTVGAYSFTAGQEFAPLPTGSVDRNLIYGESAPLPFEVSQVQVSDPSVLQVQREAVVAQKPGTAFIAISSNQEGKNQSMAIFSVKVSKKSLSTSEIIVQDKDYDGTTNAQLEQQPQLNQSQIVAGDEQKLTLLVGKPVFADKNAGENKNVQLSLKLGGEKAGCYELQIPALQADIHKLPLTIKDPSTLEAYRGQGTDVSSLVEYEGFLVGETPENLEQKGEFNPGQIQVDWENGVDKGTDDAKETISYPVIVVGCSATNYEFPESTGCFYQETTYLGKENQDFVLQYRSIEIGDIVWILGNVTVSIAEGSSYAKISKTEDFASSGTSIVFDQSEVKARKVSFYLKKGEYDPNDPTLPLEDAGAVARVIDFPLPQSDFAEPELSGLTYRLKNGSGPQDTIDGKDDLTDLADINRFYRETVTVSFQAQDADSGLASVLCEWIDGENIQTKQITINEKYNEKQTLSFDVAPQFKGYIRLTLQDRAGHSTTLIYDYLSVDALNPTVPTVSATAGGAAYLPEENGQENWTNKDVQVTVQGSEALSGIQMYEYTITDGGQPTNQAQWGKLQTTEAQQADGASPYNALKGQLVVDEDTDQTYWFRAVSNVKTPDGGKVVSDPVSLTIFRQTVAPDDVQVRISPEVPESGWYTAAPTIGFAQQGNDSTHLAPMTIYYKFWNTLDPSTNTYSNQSGADVQPVAYQGNNPPTIQEDGIYRLIAWVEDAAGNRSSRDVEMTFQVDSQKPVIEINYDNNESENDNYYKEERTATITIKELNFQEEHVEAVLTSPDGQTKVSKFTTGADNITHTAQVVFIGDGSYTLAVSCTDLAGNQSAVPEDQFIIDKRKPEQVEISYEDNWFREILNAITFHKFFQDTVDVKIRAYDETSGVETIEYWSNGINGDGEDKNQKGVLTPVEVGEGYYEATFTIQPQFKGSFSAMATDRAGNSSDSVTSESIYIDDTVPNAPRVDTQGYEAGTWTNQDVELVVTGSGAFSGIDRYEYTIADGPLDGSENWVPLTEGKVVQADSQDAAANVTRSTLTVSGDVNKTFYIRGVSNSQVAGDITACQVKVQKTLPDNASVSAASANQESWYQTDPHIIITPPDSTDSPQPESAPITVYYKLWNRSQGETEATAPVHTFTGQQPAITQDGEYMLLVWTEDEAGNQCRQSQRILREYQVDFTDPVISLSYNNNNAQNQNYYGAGRTATITVEELNFNPDKIQVEITATRQGQPISVPALSSWVSQGTTHRATVSFAADGDYTIRVSGSDRADNTAAPIETQSFTVDTQAPELAISGVEDLSANPDPISLVISYSDINLDIQRISFSLQGSQRGSVPVEGTPAPNRNGYVLRLPALSIDDNYRLVATIVDMAGNTTQESISFSVNQFGSTFEFLQSEVQNSYTNRPFSPAVRVWNVDEVTIVSVALNGKNVPYTFANGVIQLDEQIVQEGKYVFTVEVRDAAGNVSSMNPIEFFLDTTQPEIQVEGVSQGAWYFDPVSATLTLKNPEDQISSISINGKEVAKEDWRVSSSGSANPIDSASGSSVILVLKDYQEYTLTATAVDGAGNTSSLEPISFTISNNFFYKLYDNKPLFWGIVAGLAVILLGGGYALFSARRRRRREHSHSL